MTITQLNEILAEARRDVEAGQQPCDVSTRLCKLHNLNWAYLAPIVLGFRK